MAVHLRYVTHMGDVELHYDARGRSCFNIRECSIRINCIVAVLKYVEERYVVEFRALTVRINFICWIDIIEVLYESE